MTLEEIFKTNPDLLKEPEVKLLIEQAQVQYHKARERWQASLERENRVMCEAFSCDLFVIGGTPEEAIKQIINILE